MATVEELEAENKRLRASVRGYKGMLGARGAVDTAYEPLGSALDTAPEHSPRDDWTSRRRQTDHVVKDWQPFCTSPGCSEENPYFKDETECDEDEGGCGRTLGSIKTAARLASCPHCKNPTKAKVKLDRWVQCKNCSHPIAATAEEARQVSECSNCGASGEGSLEWSDN